MRDPNTNWFFQPRLAGHEARSHDDDSAPGLIGLPAAMLQRHGARVLDPGTAVAVDGFPTPRPTVYQARTLLLPAEMHGPASIDALNKVLGRIGVNLVPPARGHGVDEPQLPRPVVLAPAKDSDKPAEVNAWLARVILSRRSWRRCDLGGRVEDGDLDAAAGRLRSSVSRA